MSDIDINKIEKSKVSVIATEVPVGANLLVDQSDTTFNFIINPLPERTEQPSNILTFESSDTLTISKLFKKLTNDGIRDCDCIIKVSGYDNYLEKSRFIAGSSGTGYINGYIRRLEVEEDGQLLDIGGCNATSERIAANKIEVILSSQAFSHLADTEAHFYDNNLKSNLSHQQLNDTIKYNLPQQTIAIAKQLNDEVSLKIVTDMLYKPLKHKTMSTVTEAFKSFSSLYRGNITLANMTLHELQAFVKRHKSTSDYSNSIIYAIESMSYIVRHHKLLKGLHSKFLLSLLSTNESFIESHQDILWASLVSLKGCISTKDSNDKLTRILGDVDCTQPNAQFIIPIGNDLLYSQEAEFSE